jgi:mannose-6-phosphate isomerase-like protein (cupin superfamily)
MHCFNLITVLLLYSCVTPITIGAQTVSKTDTIGSTSKTENIYNKALYSDSLCSSFCIVIKNEVKPHKHHYHSEHVTVLEGEGLMKLDGKSFTIRKGDVVFIPKNAVHSVKRIGLIPLKVISVQAPYFDGKDRVIVEE